jgi:hypothetical protein
MYYMAANGYFEMSYFHFWDLDQVKLWRDDRVRTETFIRDNCCCAAESNIGVKDRANDGAKCQTEAKINVGANAESDLRDHGVLYSYIHG